MTALNAFRALPRQAYRRHPTLFIVNSNSSFSWYTSDDQSPWYNNTKRFIDILVALTALIVLSPLMLITALCIKLESTGPIFFHQTRCGKQGRHFRFWKFRSMYTDSEERRADLLARSDQSGIRFKMANDPRITRVGKFIRKYSIDELPQLWNVLVGEMSIVGPRPPIPAEVKAYNLYHHRRLAVRPGITCTWQIEGRSNIPFEQQVDMDVAYIRNRTLINDLRILIKTPLAVITARGAC